MSAVKSNIDFVQSEHFPIIEDKMLQRLQALNFRKALAGRGTFSSTRLCAIAILIVFHGFLIAWPVLPSMNIYD